MPTAKPLCASYKLGIVTKVRGTETCGAKKRRDKLGTGFVLIFPAVFLPEFTGVVASVYGIQRYAEGRFVSISGLIDDKS